ncbi:MAG: MipA/OmpV family protein, partial [Sphingomonadales bacterium]|nr:MipA/OmpV family protein [Sphingomonadales bacterium]
YAGARAKWASKAYNQTIFGVTAEQAQISGLAEFHPGAGFATTDVNLVGRYKVYPNLFLEGLIGSMVILGGPAKSPLVADKGNNLQMIGGVGLRYAF